MFNGTQGSPASTCAANKIKVITWLGESDEGWLTIAFALCVFLNHQPVHDFLDDKQFRKSPNPASVCSVATHLVTDIAESVTMPDSPSESSFNGGFPADEDMVVKDEGLIARTAFKLLSKRVTFNTPERSN